MAIKEEKRLNSHPTSNNLVTHFPSYDIVLLGINNISVAIITLIFVQIRL